MEGDKAAYQQDLEESRIQPIIYQEYLQQFV